MNSFVPSHYHIVLTPDLARYSFDGTVTITGQLETGAASIELNALELEVSRCLLTAGGSQSGASCDFQLETEKQTLTIRPPVDAGGPITLTIDFVGVLNDKMAGFYRSFYGGTEAGAGGDSDGQGVLAITQFEEKDARRAFPCVDHPAAKATFDVELVVDNRLTALSNQDVLSEDELPNGKKRVRFERTPRMSTYLVFFGVGAFEMRRDAEDHRVRAYMLPGNEDYVEPALRYGREALRYCEEQFGVPYPLAKLDLIAVPDFAFGAMENWGAITFRENLLLTYPGITSRAAEGRIAEIVAHEIVHHWFGDLVTPTDWKYLWLNESFATLYGNAVVDYFHGEWGVWEGFLRGATAGSMGRDALQHTVPIEIPGESALMINASTAPIIYSKGASVLRQIQGYLGEDTFRAGLAHYLQEHAYDNAESSHFWEALEQAAGRPLAEMMRGWIEQPGFPLVSVRRTGNTLELEQKRFTYLPGAFEQLWDIPLTVTVFGPEGGGPGTAGTGRQTEVLRHRLHERRGTLELPPWTEAYKINSGQTGYYRVHYREQSDLERLRGLVTDRTLSAEDRWGLQGDLYALVRSGEVTIEHYLDFLEAYRGETAYLPLSGAVSSLLSLHDLLVGKPGRPDPDAGELPRRVTEEAIRFLEHALKLVGIEPRPDEPLTSARLRSQALASAVYLGVAWAEDFALVQLEALRQDRSVDANLLGSILEVGALTGDKDTLEWMLDRYRKSRSEQDRRNVLSVLGSFPEPELLARALRFALEETPSRNKYVPIVSAAGNPGARSFLWHWFSENREAVEKLHPMHREWVTGAVIGSGGLAHPEEVKTFFADYVEGHPELRDIVELSLERLEVSLRLRARTP